MTNVQSIGDFYSVIEVLGKGSFGEVVKCQKRDSGKLVAIKILKNYTVRSYAVQHEIKMLDAIKEVDKERFHILQFYEHFHDESKYYLVFELLQTNLLQYQEETGFAPLPVRHIRTISSQVLKALSKLEELSIIHADLKPDNIVLVDQNRYPFRVKVIDFGCSYILNEVRGLKEPCMQTLFYRAPEILLGLPFNEKMDMWSLGCIMAELHLGAPLYPGSTEYDQVRYICETQGLPKKYLLDSASKAVCFFNRRAGLEWTLKTADEYQMETSEWRNYILNSLDQLQFINRPWLDDGHKESQADDIDRKYMVEIIKCMLTWDSRDRINPEAAMNHPFINLQHLRTDFKFTTYYQLAQESLNDSLKKEMGLHFDAPLGTDYSTGDLAHDSEEMEMDKKPPYTVQKESTTFYGHLRALITQNISRYFGWFASFTTFIFKGINALYGSRPRWRDDEWVLI